MLKAAADLGVPVFVHPQTDPQLHKRFSRTGRIGLRLARGTINNAALINMLESGAFDEAPKLQLVVTTLALGGLMLAGGFGDGARIRSDAPALTRRHVYVDTMGINPVTVRAAIDLLGADHVLRRTATLSPGERTRAVLARFAAQGVNCLVLDEPTNHLDLPAIQQLEAALDGYDGTLLLVSHDRALLDAVRVTRAITANGEPVEV